jgi:hypothetical protein
MQNMPNCGKNKHVSSRYLSTAGQSMVELLENDNTAATSNDESIPCKTPFTLVSSAYLFVKNS